MIVRYLWIALSCLLPLTAFAQQPTWELGPFAAWQFGEPTAIDRASSNIKTFQTNGQGKSWENSGLGGIRFDANLSEGSSLSFRVFYSQTHGEFKSQYFTDTDRVVKIFRLIEDVDAAHLSTQWLYAISRHSYIGLGLSGSLRLTTIALERVEPVDLPLPYDTVITGGSITAPAFNVGVPLSLGLRIDPASWLTIAPEITGLIDVSEFLRGGGSRALRGGASIALVFHPSTDTESSPALIATEEPEPPTLLKLHFTDEGIATNRVVAQIADTTLTRYTELPSTYITAIPELDRTLTRSVDTFALSLLNRTSAAEAYRQYFDIMRTRLKHSSSITSLRISGTREAIAHARESLERFFAGSAEMLHFTERVSKSSDVTITIDSNSELISPVVGEWSERSYILPSMSLEKFIASPRGINHWEITLSEEGHVLKRWSSEDGPEALVFPPLSLASHRLLGRLDVVDTAGRIFLDYDSLIVELPDERVDTVRPATRTQFVLLPARTRSAIWHRLIMQELETTTHSRTAVTLQPLGPANDESGELPQEVLSMVPINAVHGFSVIPIPVETIDLPSVEGAYVVTIQ